MCHSVHSVVCIYRFCLPLSHSLSLSLSLPLCNCLYTNCLYIYSLLVFFVQFTRFRRASVTLYICVYTLLPLLSPLCLCLSVFSLLTRSINAVIHFASLLRPFLALSLSPSQLNLLASLIAFPLSHSLSLR